MSKLVIDNLYVEAHGKKILNGLSLTIDDQQIHAIMGPNGSGKSTLSNTIMGHPNYRVISGKIWLDDVDVLKLSVDERAKAGLFLAMQAPTEIPGVNLSNLLRTAKIATSSGDTSKKFNLAQWIKSFNSAMNELKMGNEFKNRGVNEGFSGGEKKRSEILQLNLLAPKVSILDEIDSGLDVDALREISSVLNNVVKRDKSSLLVITHYVRILEYLKPDKVSVLAKGRIVDSGDGDFAKQLEKQGYDKYLT